jgi:hypothetical protein
MEVITAERGVMRRTFMDDQFDEWEAYVSGGQPRSAAAARILFVCLSNPERKPRFVRHSSGDPAEAEHELHHMDEAALLDLFHNSEPVP